MKPLPTIERLRQVLEVGRYGFLYWAVDVGRSTKAGDMAGTVNGAGYVQVTVDRRIVPAHRIVWALLYGSWPTGEIDHINGVRSDNRPLNLRDATVTQNRQNAARRSDNKTGFKGVCFDKARGLYAAHISVDGRTKNLGRYLSPEQAHAAYCAASETLRGEFSRTI